MLHEGHCKFGNQCWFSHDAAAMQGAKKTKNGKPPCKFFQDGSCQKGDECEYSHTQSRNGAEGLGSVALALVAQKTSASSAIESTMQKNSSNWNRVDMRANGRRAIPCDSVAELRKGTVNENSYTDVHVSSGSPVPSDFVAKFRSGRVTSSTRSNHKSITEETVKKARQWAKDAHLMSDEEWNELLLEVASGSFDGPAAELEAANAREVEADLFFAQSDIENLLLKRSNKKKKKKRKRNRRK